MTEHQAESHIEKKVCEYAKSLGWLVYKFVSPGKRSVPDRIFLRDGWTFFIEFKGPDKLPTQAQLREIRKIVNTGHLVFVVNGIDMGRGIVDMMSAEQDSRRVDVAEETDDE